MVVLSTYDAVDPTASRGFILTDEEVALCVAHKVQDSLEFARHCDVTLSNNMKMTSIVPAETSAVIPTIAIVVIVSRVVNPFR